MAGSCECESESCSTETCRDAEGKCRCGTACGGDPVECGVGMWSGAFFQALKETQVEILKAKIQKAWGARMDKAADAVLETMEAQWQGMLAQARSKSDLRARLQALWQQGKK